LINEIERDDRNRFTSQFSEALEVQRAVSVFGYHRDVVGYLLTRRNSRIIGRTVSIDLNVICCQRSVAINDKTTTSSAHQLPI
jgi:hypothetical protein